jgi:hypothetical protein
MHSWNIFKYFIAFHAPIVKTGESFYKITAEIAGETVTERKKLK